MTKKTQTRYAPKIGETYRWLAYQYSALFLFGTIWLSETLFPSTTPWILLASQPSFLVLTVAAGVIVIALSIFGIKNAEQHLHHSFVRALLLSLPGSVGIVGFVFLGARFC